jgi:hypothetical protein
LDKKDLAGATIWLFVERNCGSVRPERASTKKEIPVWIGEDKATDCSVAKAAKAKEPA